MWQANARELKRTTQLLTRRDRAALAAGDDPSPSPDSREEEEEAAPEAAVRVRLPDGCMLQVRSHQNVLVGWGLLRGLFSRSISDHTRMLEMRAPRAGAVGGVCAFVR